MNSRRETDGKRWLCTIDSYDTVGSPANRVRLQQQLLETMAELRALASDVDKDVPSQLAFTRSGKMSLRPRPDVSLLPVPVVMAELMACAIVPIRRQARDRVNEPRYVDRRAAVD